MEWRKVPDWPYEVSEYGDVRRIGGGQGTKPKAELNSYKLTKFNYRAYDLYKNGERWRTNAHTLVALVFIGPKPSEKHEVAHNDTNSLNNHYSNLRWATRKENIQDTIKAGKFKFLDNSQRTGLKNNKAIDSITEESLVLARAIKSDLRNGFSQNQTAKRNGTSRSHVRVIQHDKTNLARICENDNKIKEFFDDL